MAVSEEGAVPVYVHPAAFSWSTDVFAAAVVANGPIKVPMAALAAVRSQGMGLALYQEWDEETQTMTYTVPEHG